MAVRNDRVGELLEGVGRKRKELISPEGVPLDIKIASVGERFNALILDLLFMLIACVILFILLLFAVYAGLSMYLSGSLFLIMFFLIRNMYFIHFELAWQGRTPGKKICGLRVINRAGGELTPAAIIARNLTREIELFLPIQLLFSLTNGGLSILAALGWVLIIACIPLFNRENLRAGDLIGGTMVITMPKRALLGDLTLAPATVKNTANINPNAAAPKEEAGAGYTFTHEQLAIYGAFELQVLEEFLRRPPHVDNDRTLTEICIKICNKIGWTEPVKRSEVRAFLNDFYTKQREELERGQLFGKLREDKTQGKRAVKPGAKPN